MRNKKKNAFARAFDSLVHALTWPERLWSRYQLRRAKEKARKGVPIPPAPKPKVVGWWSRLKARLRKIFGLKEPGYVPPPMTHGTVKRSFGNRLRRFFGSQDLVVSYERNPRTLSMWLGAIPAVIALVGLAVVSFGFDVSEGRMVSKYRLMASKAQDDGNDALAEVCLRRVAKGSITDEEKLRLVNLEIKRKQMDRARALVDEMVSMERQGFPRAHRLKVRFLMEQGQLNQEQIRELEAHLKFCLDDESLRYEAHLLLGELYGARGRIALAEDHLRKAMIRLPEAALLLAEICRVQGKKDLIPGLHSDYLAYAIPRLEVDQTNDALRRRVVDTLLRLDEHVKALEVLERTTPLQGSAVASELRAVVLTRFAAHELAQKNEVKAFRLVEQGLLQFPNFVPLYQVLIKLAEGSSEKAAEANERVEKLLAGGGPLADALHLILAANAGTKNDFEKARRHFEVVFKNNPSAPEIANNLAVSLSSVDPPQLERALSLADQAAKSAPKHPQIRETRGQIYVRLKKWNEALEDLEFAVREMPNHAGVHQGLADTYDALGEKTLAEQHRQTAQRLNIKPK
jgi:tetratricopeptide (TPR) repeat protein